MILECQCVLEGQSDLGLHCLLRPVPIPSIIMVKRKCYGILALDRISCAMVWSFVVMNLTISGIIYKKVCYLDLEVIGMGGCDDE